MMCFSSPSQSVPHSMRGQISRGNCNQDLFSNLLNLLPALRPSGSGRVSWGSPGLTCDCSIVSGSLGRAIPLGHSPNTCERSSPPALSIYWEYGVQDRCPDFLGSPSATIGTKQKNGKGNFHCRKLWCMFTNCSSWE